MQVHLCKYSHSCVTLRLGSHTTDSSSLLAFLLTVINTMRCYCSATACSCSYITRRQREWTRTSIIVQRWIFKRLFLNAQSVLRTNVTWRGLLEQGLSIAVVQGYWEIRPVLVWFIGRVRDGLWVISLFFRNWRRARYTANKCNIEYSVRCMYNIQDVSE